MKSTKLISVVICFCLLLTSITVLAQSQTLATKELPKAINLNDKNYIRIYDGQVVDDNYVIEKFENIKYIGKSRAIELGLNFEKPVVIINSDKTEIEDEILKRLFARKDFLQRFVYPLDTRLPIVVNGKLLTNEIKASFLSKITLSQISQIVYSDNTNTKVGKNLAPFGVINIKVE